MPKLYELHFGCKFQTDLLVLRNLKRRRPNVEYLLSIRKGKVDLDISKAEEDVLKLEELYRKADLPDEVNSEFVNDLLEKIRMMSISKFLL
jgi:hypothetical protein